jgi:serine protease AprX
MKRYGKVRWIALGFALALGAAIALGSQRTDAATAKIGASLVSFVRSDSVGPMRILVILSEQADLRGVERLASKEARGRFVYDRLRKAAIRSQGPLVSAIQKRGFSIRRHYLLNMLSIEDASRGLILELAARPDVKRIVADPLIRNRLPGQGEDDGEIQTGSGPEANLKRVGADKVWSELKVKGEGIVVAGQDTGVQWDHPALKAHYRGVQGDTVTHEYNWHDAIHKPLAADRSNRCGYELKAPCDDQDHGSHTMGTIVGDDGAGNQVGMAPGAKWIACRNMDAGTGAPSTYIECFEFFLAPYSQGADPLVDGKPELAPHVINNSWGCPKSEGCEGKEILPVVEALKKAGILVVASAGNDGSACSTIQDPPAFYTDTTLSVGAMDHRTDKIASFSSRGPSTFDGGLGPDVAAPGVSIRSSVPGGSYASTWWSGTSMAGPHVVGEVALLWSAAKSLIGKIDETTRIIRASALPTQTTESCGNVPGNSSPNNTFGYGIIDAYQAVRMGLAGAQ